MMDSHESPQDLGAWSSRGTMWSGHATADAARGAAEALKSAAAAKFSTDPSQVRLIAGEAHCDADAVPVGDLVALAEGAADGCLRVEGSYLTDVDKMDKVHGLGHFSPAYSFCVQAVEVEVDYATGQVRVLDAVTVHDSGAALNPAGAEGQAVGAMTMGLGAALSEELVYEQGQLVNPSLLDYRAPRASDLPHVRAVLLDGHDPAGPYGAKGIGEIGVVPAPAAVANAVAHATGVRVREVPITPEKLLRHLTPDASTALIARRRQLSSAFSFHRMWTDLIRELYDRGLFRFLHRASTRRTRRRGRSRPGPARLSVQAIERPGTVHQALEAAVSPAVRTDYIAGGTDLLVTQRQGLRAPVRLIDTTSIRELRQLEETPEGDLRIGAAVTLEDLRRRVSGPGARPGDAMLADLLEELATHQIRELATAGGNLLQEKRCGFYRNGFDCYKRGGWTRPCYAVLGDHRFHHAVIGGHRCQAVTPSDLATGLLALDAVAHSLPPGSKPPRRRAIDELYAGPGEPDLNAGELLTVLEVPAAARARRAAFEKLKLYAGDFAVCSAAVSLELDTDGVTIVDARISLGAVAPKPYRAKRSEKWLIGASLHDSEALREASWAWPTDTHPLLGNVWKVQATCGLLLRVLNRVASIASN